MPTGLHRSYGAHHWHFVTCSCYRRLPFLSLPRSRDCFLSVLEQVRARYRFVVVGYVVMPEHIPLPITEHGSSYRHYLLDEVGPVQVNVGWAEIWFKDRVA